MAIIETEAALHEAHRDNHTHRDVNGGWLRPAVFGAMARGIAAHALRE